MAKRRHTLAPQDNPGNRYRLYIDESVKARGHILILRVSGHASRSGSRSHHLDLQDSNGVRSLTLPSPTRGRGRYRAGRSVVQAH